MFRDFQISWIFRVETAYIKHNLPATSLSKFVGKASCARFFHVEGRYIGGFYNIVHLVATFALI